MITLPAGSRSYRGSHPRVAAHQRPSGRSHSARNDRSTITSPTTTTRSRTQISPGIHGAIQDTTTHNHSPPQALTRARVQISDSAEADSARCATVLVLHRSITVPGLDVNRRSVRWRRIMRTRRLLIQLVLAVAAIQPGDDRCSSKMSVAATRHERSLSHESNNRAIKADSGGAEGSPDRPGEYRDESARDADAPIRADADALFDAGSAYAPRRVLSRDRGAG